MDADGKTNVTQMPPVTRIQELIYELPISRIMTADVITLTPGHCISELKEILRVRRISGTPVVDQGKLVGIVSVEDLIRALEQGSMNDPVGLWMTRDLVTVQMYESVVEAVRKFAQFKVGRLPVVNEQGDLAGILVGSDITRGLLEILGMSQFEEENKHYRAIDIFREVIADETSIRLRYDVQGGDFKAGGKASSRLKRTLHRLGLPPDILRRVAIAAYEAEMNLVIHTERGGQIHANIGPEKIVVLTVDDGPGIPDVEQALKAGYSTAPNWIRELGFGAGMGLANINHCADEMKLSSRPGEGTRLEITIYPGLQGKSEASKHDGEESNKCA